MEAQHGAPGRAAIFLRFLRFGFLAWGGPVAQIAMLRRELVEEERWLEGSRFNRLLAVYQVLPGPEAHELAVHLGLLRGGRLGGLLAGLGFMLPGFVLVLLLAALYTQVDLNREVVGALLLGAQVGVIALIVRAIDGLGRHIVVDAALLGLAAAAALWSLAGVSFWVLLPTAGVAYAAARRWRWGRLLVLVLLAVGVAALAAVNLGWLPSSVALGPPAGPGDGQAPSLLDLLASGLKAGLLTFGGAYTAIPFIRDDAVGRGWLSDAQFLDGIALSGVLPAPLIIFATFVGYVAGGPGGALVMTLGVFLPAFSFGLLFGNRLEAVVELEPLHRFLEGVAAAVVGLIVATTLDLSASLAERLAQPALALPILALGLAVLFSWRSRWSVALVMALSAGAGWLLFDVLA